MLASLNMLPSKDKNLLPNDQLPYNLHVYMDENKSKLTLHSVAI